MSINGIHKKTSKRCSEVHNHKLQRHRGNNQHNDLKQIWPLKVIIFLIFTQSLKTGLIEKDKKEGKSLETPDNGEAYS